MADDMAELESSLSEDEVEEMDEEDWFNLYLPVFRRFNDTYMRTENQDAEYAMIVAAWFATIKK